MLENFENFSVDADVWASIRNVQADFAKHIGEEIRKAVQQFEGCAPECVDGNYRLEDHVIVAHGNIVRTPGCNTRHFFYRDKYLFSWTDPTLHIVGVTRVHLTYMIGTLPLPSEDTMRMLID